MRRPLRQDMRACKNIRQNASADIEFLATLVFAATRIGVVHLCSAIIGSHLGNLEHSRKLHQAPELRNYFTDVKVY